LIRLWKFALPGLLLWSPALAIELPPVEPPTGEVVDVIPAYRPQDARGPEVRQLADRISDLPASEALAAINDSSLPVIACERLLLGLARHLGESGTPVDLPVLEDLAGRDAEAEFLAPSCKRPHPHVWFPFPAEAWQAAFQIRAGASAAEVRRGGRTLAQILEDSAAPGEVFGAARESFQDFGDSTNHLLDLVTILNVDPYADRLEAQDYSELIEGARAAGNATALTDWDAWPEGAAETSNSGPEFMEST